jgi:hypothetical protein
MPITRETLHELADALADVLEQRGASSSAPSPAPPRAPKSEPVVVSAIDKKKARERLARMGVTLKETS